MPDSITLYDRPTGPLCYELDLQRWLPYVPRQLLGCGLSWCWASCRLYATAPDSPVQGLPEKRDWTRLSGATSWDLIDDLYERDVADGGRFVVIAGFGSSPGQNLEQLLPGALDRFAAEQDQALSALVLNQPDSSSQLVFVAQEHLRARQAQTLLDTWHISSASVSRTRPYPSLGVARLEALNLNLNDWVTDKT